MNAMTTAHNIFTTRIFIMIWKFNRKNQMGYWNIPKENQIYTRRKIQRAMKMQEKNNTQDMKMDHPEEDIILDDDEDKYDDVIYEEEVDCEGVRKSRRQCRPVEILEQLWDNTKLEIEKIKCMEYSEKKVKSIARVIGDLRNNTMEKTQDLHEGISAQRNLKGLDEKGVMH